MLHWRFMDIVKNTEWGEGKDRWGGRGGSVTIRWHLLSIYVGVGLPSLHANFSPLSSLKFGLLPLLPSLSFFLFPSIPCGYWYLAFFHTNCLHFPLLSLCLSSHCTTLIWFVLFFLLFLHHLFPLITRPYFHSYSIQLHSYHPPPIITCLDLLPTMSFHLFIRHSSLFLFYTSILPFLP